MVYKCQYQSPYIVQNKLKSTSGNRRKTLEMPENTGFLGGVAANWLQKSVINLLSE